MVGVGGMGGWGVVVGSWGDCRRGVLCQGAEVGAVLGNTGLGR